MKTLHAIKKCIVFISLFAFINTIHAQTTNWDTLPWKTYADYKLQLLNKSYMSTTVLYDRVFPIANVDGFTGHSSDTSSPAHFVQAYDEIYNAAYNTSGWITPDSLNSLLTNTPEKNANPIGIFYYKFNELDTNALQDHLVDTNANGQFRDVASRPRNPYFTFTSFIASPLLSEEQAMNQGKHVFYLDPQLFLHN